MEKVKCVFAGGRKLGVNILRWLCQQDYMDIVGVCTLPADFDPSNIKEMHEIIDGNALPEYDICRLSNINFDLGLSVNYHKIISGDILQRARLGFFNLHHSYNMRLRGRNVTTHAILNCRTDNIFYHGTTLHKMVPKLDAGPIVASKSCPIYTSDTAYSLFARVDDLAYDMLCEWIPRLSKEAVYLYEAPSDGVHYYKNSDLPDKSIELDHSNADEVYDFVRAFDFPGYEPAFFYYNREKIHLVLNRRNEYVYKIHIKENDYYTDYSLCGAEK